MNELLAFSVLLVVSVVLDWINKGLLFGTSVENFILAYQKSLKELELLFIISVISTICYWWCQVEVVNIFLKISWGLVALIFVLMMFIFAMASMNELIHPKIKYTLFSDMLISKSLIFCVSFTATSSALTAATVILKKVSPII